MRRAALAAAVIGALALTGCVAATAGGSGEDASEASDGATSVDAKTVSSTYIHEGLGIQTLTLPAAPPSATAVRVRFTCLSAGVFTWGPSADLTTKVTCLDGDRPTGAWYDFPLWSAPDGFSVAAAPTGRWAFTAFYVMQRQWGWVFNAHGDAYLSDGSTASLGDRPATAPATAPAD